MIRKVLHDWGWAILIILFIGSAMFWKEWTKGEMPDTNNILVSRLKKGEIRLGHAAIYRKTVTADSEYIAIGCDFKGDSMIITYMVSAIKDSLQ